jgi:hypothetical protein
MGADLYIHKVRKPVKAEWQPKFDAAVAQRNAAQDDAAKAEAQKLVDEAYDKLWGGDGYFRDSYNGTSVLWRLGLSWWQDMKPDIDPESNPDGNNVSVDACRAFLAKVLAAEMKPATRADLLANNCAVDDGECSVESWNKFYREKRDRLIAFLERAIEHGGFYASC